MFKRPSPIEELVDKATSDLLTTEDWQQNMIICDMIPRADNGARDCVNAILRRLSMGNPKVACYAVSLCEACIKNCGLGFHQEVASKHFLNPVIKMINNKSETHPTVRNRLLTLIEDCAREFRYDLSLGLVDSEYQTLKRQGVVFPEKAPPKELSQKDKQKEEEELQIALALSLSEAESKKKPAAGSWAGSKPAAALPGSIGKTESTSSLDVEEREERRGTEVRALYDFAGAERGEVGFKKGDVLVVLEKTHTSWWKGKLKHRPESSGLFPSNYVEELGEEDAGSGASAAVDIDAKAVGKLLEMLQEIDPEKDNVVKNTKIQKLLKQCTEMAPVILEQIVELEKKKDELIVLNETVSRSKGVYERLLYSSVPGRGGAVAVGVPHLRGEYPGGPGASAYVPNAPSYEYYDNSYYAGDGSGRYSPSYGYSGPSVPGMAPPGGLYAPSTPSPSPSPSPSPLGSGQGRPGVPGAYAAGSVPPPGYAGSVGGGGAVAPGYGGGSGGYGGGVGQEAGLQHSHSNPALSYSSGGGSVASSGGLQGERYSSPSLSMYGQGYGGGSPPPPASSGPSAHGGGSSLAPAAPLSSSVAPSGPYGAPPAGPGLQGPATSVGGYEQGGYGGGAPQGMSSSSAASTGVPTGGVTGGPRGEYSAGGAGGYYGGQAGEAPYQGYAPQPGYQGSSSPPPQQQQYQSQPSQYPPPQQQQQQQQYQPQQPPPPKVQDDISLIDFS